MSDSSRDAKPEAGSSPVSPSPDSPNKRLSAETLFAFALPETMTVMAPASKIAAAVEASKPASIKRSAAELSALSKAPGRSKGTWPLVLIAFFILGVTAFYFLGLSQYQTRLSDYLSESRSRIAAWTKSVVSGNAIDKEQRLSLVADLETSVARDAERQPKKADVPPKDEILDQLSSNDVKVIDAGIQKAISSGKQQHLKAVWALATSKEPLVRVSLAKAFVDPSKYPNVQPAEVVSNLIGLVSDSDYLVRGYAVRAIGNSGVKSAVPSLLEQIEKEKEEVVLKLLKIATQKLNSR